MWRLFSEKAKTVNAKHCEMLDAIESLIGPPVSGRNGDIWSLEQWIGKAVAAGIISTGEGIVLYDATIGTAW